ncbi:MAG: adenylate/guanylate cyclase domain-containing protein [Pseudomonadota bacterium]
MGQIGLFYNSVLFELEQSFGQVKRQQEDLSQALTEKETLIDSILPKRIAQRMTAGEEQIVDQIADATVVFVDIVDFTAYSASVPPAESMALLEDLFGRYDEVIRAYDLEKIKTIGDSYMFVAGVTRAQADHCAAAVDAALELLFVTNQLAQKLGRDLTVRIGVHSGPLVAGLIGDLRFVYDLWGTTVNVAARIEEAGKPGKVSVSEAVLTRLADEFSYQRQGRVRLKGIGPTLLYSIEGRQATLKRA